MNTKKVNLIGLKKLANTGHLGFHVEVNKFFNSCGAKNIASVEELPLYNSAIAVEIDIVKRQRASSITTNLEQMDKERDELISYLFAIIGAAKHAPLAEAKDAHRQLLPVLKPYKGLANYPNIQESGGIIALLKDLRAERFVVHVETLGLTNAMDLLDKKNDDYIEFDKQRIIDAPSKVVTDAIRTKVDTIYQQIIDRVNAVVILTPNDAAEALIEHLNKYIDQTNHSYNIRMAHSASRTSKNEAEKNEADNSVAEQ